MMVIPTECDEVVGVVVTAGVLFFDVVGLQPVTAAASFDGALAPVPLENECSNRRRDRLGSMRDLERSVGVAVDDAGAAAAENLSQGVWSEAEAAAGGGSGFSVRRCGHGGVYKDFRYDDRPSGFLTFGSTSEAVETQIGQSVG